MRVKNSIRRRIIITIITLSMLILSGNSLITRAEGLSSGIVWTDDFDDGTYAPEWTVVMGDYSASENFLRAGNNITQWYVIKHANTITSGTWSFDAFFDGTISMANRLGVMPISSGSNFDGYEFLIWYEKFALSKFTDNEEIILCEHYIDLETTFIWRHVDITRDTSGKFNVYIDGELILQAIDSTYQSSQDFVFSSKWKHAIDNITISDTINVHPDPSDLKFEQESAPVECELGTSEDVQINVKNYGEDFGSASLVVGTTPDGITVTLDSETITDLKSKGSYNYKAITATINVASTVEAGSYDVIIELYNQSADVIDSITLDVTVTEADTTTTNGNGTPGFMVVWTFLTIGLAALINRKRR